MDMGAGTTTFPQSLKTISVKKCDVHFFAVFASRIVPHSATAFSKILKGYNKAVAARMAPHSTTTCLQNLQNCKWCIFWFPGKRRTHSLTHSLTHPLTHSLTHSPTHPRTHKGKAWPVVASTDRHLKLTAHVIIADGCFCCLGLQP